MGVGVGAKTESDVCSMYQSDVCLMISCMSHVSVSCMSDMLVFSVHITRLRVGAH